MQDEPTRVSSLGTRGKGPVVEPICELDPSGTSLGVFLGDGLKSVLLQVDSPPHADNVPLRSQTERAVGGLLLQAFGADGDSLFDDVEERSTVINCFPCCEPWLTP